MLSECENCRDVQVKKFSPLRDLIDFRELDGNYMKCECGKRPLDIVMSNILKIMIESEIVPEKATLRRNSPVPLSEFYYSSFNPQFIGEKALILLHPDFTAEVYDHSLLLSMFWSPMLTTNSKDERSLCLGISL